MFVDQVKIILKSGDGGDGCLSFHRARFLPKGGPDGGDGGDGGSIILVGDVHQNDLSNYKLKGYLRSGKGQSGKGGNQSGASAKDLKLPLPLGTVVYDCHTDESVCEILENNQEICFLKGGKGGLGNAYFKSSVDQAPRQITLGEKTEEKKFRFELKSLADIGLVGFPNAGKSSLLGLLTAKRPKVGNYPFTTLGPSVGLLEFEQNYERIFVADIPGLIEGASKDKGLGHKFLRHIERCSHLCFILEMGGEQALDPIYAYKTLKAELKAYRLELLEKPISIIANKMDLSGASSNLKLLRENFPSIKIYPISCKTSQGLLFLKQAFYDLFFKT